MLNKLHLYSAIRFRYYSSTQFQLSKYLKPLRSKNRYLKKTVYLNQKLLQKVTKGDAKDGSDWTSI
jgi:hypothetical protein